MAGPLDLAAALAVRKKKSIGSLSLPDLTGSGMNAQDAQTAVNTAAENSMKTTSTTPPGFQQTPMVTPAAQALGQATMGATNQVNTAAAQGGESHLTPEDQAQLDAERAAAKSAPASAPATAASFAGAGAGGFDYSGMTRTPEQMQAEARARAGMQIDTRAQAAKDALARYQAGATTQRKGQLTNLAGMEEGNRYRFAGSNLGTSGFMAGANAVAQGTTQDNIGRINTDERLAMDATNNQLGELEKLRGSVETATLADLERMNNDVQFKGADLNSVLQGRNFDLTRGRLRLPKELQGMDLTNQGMGLANQGAAFNLERGRGLLPYELGNAATNLQRNQGMLPLDVLKAKYGIAGDALQLDTATKMQSYTLEGARLGNERSAQVNKMGELEYTLANDPDVGRRKQAEVGLQKAHKDLELMDAKIKQANAKALTGGSKGSYTAWQQYQIEQDKKGEGEKAAAAKEKARTKLVDSFRSDYNISHAGADMWVDFMDLATSPKADGTMPSRDELNELSALLIDNPAIPQGDKDWIRKMFWAGQGEQWAQDELNTIYRKKPIGP